MKRLRYLSIALSAAFAMVMDVKKVTKDFLESEIANVKYQRLDATLTHCTITTHDGFTFTGESACIYPAQFDEEIGKQIAYKQAFDKMYMPYGFWLHKTLKHQNQAEKDNVEETYQMTGDEQFGIELAVALAENGETVKRANGVTLTAEDVNAVDWQVA